MWLRNVVARAGWIFIQAVDSCILVQISPAAAEQIQGMRYQVSVSTKRRRARLLGL